MGEGLLLSSRVAKCVAGNVVGSDGCRDPPGTVGTIERDCDVDDGDRRVSLRTIARAQGNRLSLSSWTGPARINLYGVDIDVVGRTGWPRWIGRQTRTSSGVSGCWPKSIQERKTHVTRGYERLLAGPVSGQTRSRCPAEGSPRGCPPSIGVALFRSAVRRAPLTRRGSKGTAQLVVALPTVDLSPDIDTSDQPLPGPATQTLQPARPTGKTS